MLVDMAALLDLLLPPACPGCGREGTVLCEVCARPLARRLDEPPGAPVGLAAQIPAGMLQVEWCAAYSGSVRAALHTLKYSGTRALAEPLGRAMAERWRRAGLGGELIVHVPVHDQRLRERGYDQAALLAAVVGRRLELPVVAALRRAHATEAQHSLGRGARARNLGHAFEVARAHRSDVQGRWVLVVADILTTGSTFAAAAAALRDAGAQAVSGLVVARDR
jgi:ComF family protein